MNLSLDPEGDTEPFYADDMVYYTTVANNGYSAKSILISCGARLAPFDIKELRDLTSYDELGLDMIGDEKTALFVSCQWRFVKDFLIMFTKILHFRAKKEPGTYF